MKVLRNKTTAAAAVIGLLGMTGLSANAADVTEVTANSAAERVEITVDYSDLNLASASGQQVLYKRIENAATEICGHTDYRRAGGLSEARANRACFEETMSRAMSRVTQAQVASTN